MIYSKTNPYIGRISSKESLVKYGSTKQTYHLVIDIKNSGINYRPGDSVAIYPENNPFLVDHLISKFNARGDEEIIDSRSGQTYSLKDFLTYKANLSRLTSSLLKVIFENEQNDENKQKLRNIFQKENKHMLMEYIQNHHVVDVLNEYDIKKCPLQDICAQFGPLLPRFYSISSSQMVHPDEIHLTVALYTYNHAGEQKFGVASHFLCHVAEENSTNIPLYIQPTHSFLLPEDNDASIIMIGPGTGVAPFRAFLQERVARESNGKNWLFFGERNKNSDYFYGEYFEKLQKDGHLKIDLAFSRDQNEKIYVQDRMRENSKQLWDWLENGAYFYVCGDASRMAKDVDIALLEIIQKEGNLSEESAKQYVKALKAQKRYRADVY